MKRPPQIPDSEVLEIRYERQPIRRVTCMGFCGKPATGVYVATNHGGLVAACCIEHAADWFGDYLR